MESDKSFSAPLNQTALQEAEFAALIRMLSISEGTFSLSLAICNSPALREYLIGKIQEEKQDIEVIPIEKDTTSVFSFVEKKINNKRPSAIFVTEIEKAISSDDTQSKVIRTLNASRELWQDKFSCPAVFWLPEYAATILQKDAPDFGSWISHIFEFVSERATATIGMSGAYAGDIISAGRLNADQKRFRVAELEQRIEDVGEPPEARFVPHVLTWLNELAYIYKSTGELDAAEKSILRSLNIAERINSMDAIADSYGNLGLIYRIRGELDKAEQMHSKALEIDESLGRLEGMASDCGNLGIIYQIRGELDRAEQVHKKSLEFEKKLGRVEGIANQCSNLGTIYQTRGDLNKAEQMHKKSLEIEEKLGRLDGMARSYSNLGLIHQDRGDLYKAEQLLRKSLEIEEKLGQLEGVASDYGNLGTIYKQRSDAGKAREYWEKALELFKKIGMKAEIDKTQRLIDELKDN